MRRDLPLVEHFDVSQDDSKVIGSRFHIFFYVSSAGLILKAFNVVVDEIWIRIKVLPVAS